VRRGLRPARSLVRLQTRLSASESDLRRQPCSPCVSCEFQRSLHTTAPRGSTRPRSAPHVWRSLVLVSVLALGCRAEAGSVLELREASSLRLPLGVIPSGAVLADDGAFIVWSQESSWVAAYRNGTVATLCPGRAVKPVGAAFAAVDSSVQIVSQASDSAALEVLVSRGGSPCSVAYRMPAEEGVISVVPCGPGWVLGVRGAFGHGLLIGLDSFGRRQWTASDSTPGSPLDASRATMTAGRTGIVASSMLPPFRSAHVDCAGRVGGRFQAGASSAWAHGTSVGLRALELETGYLQVIADPRSDWRRLVVFDTTGRVLRGRDLNVAFGLLAGSPDGKRLIALRRTDVDEIVTYFVLGGRVQQKERR